MNFLITLVYMYFMITFVYPALSLAFGVNNKFGFFILY